MGTDRADDGEDAERSRMGQAPGLSGSASIRAKVSAALFGEHEAQPTGSDPVPAPESDDEAKAPLIADRARRRAKVAAKLFGGDDDEGSRAWDIDTEVAEDASRSSLSAVDQIDDEVGRFRVLERLGHGGMGVVYSAYDPELDRKIAIKVLRSDVRRGLSASDAQARLLREAQAMARLNHPNVIVVHEVGTVGERVFVAMEFVDGGTLREWMKQTHAWREVLDTFVKAGRGLAAAHEAGLVHRDFKPDNVLLGRDGRVRVLDFGLARSLLDAPEEPDTDVAPRQRPEIDTFNTPLTRTGAVMGTPAYMSPEQHLGHPADARSDQFSFCVALWEALYGQRPFSGADIITLSTNVVRGEMQKVPAEKRVPGWVGAALRRGLAPKARDRFATMDALLAELERDPRRTWRRVGLGLGVAVVASAVTYAVFGGANPAVDACTGPAQRVATVWNEGTRTRLRDAILASGEPYAERGSTTTLALFDDYLGRWQELSEQACAAGQVGDVAHQVYETKQRCLDARLAEVTQLVQALSAGGEGMARQAVPAAADLSDLGACNDPKRLAAWASPKDPQVGDAIARGRAELAKAKAKAALGDYDAAIEIASRIVDEFASLDAPAVHANALLVRGQYRERAGDYETAEVDLDEAVLQAEAAADYATKAQALTRLVFVVTREGGRWNDAKARGAEARGVLDTLDAVPLLVADLEGTLGAAARATHHFDEALQHHEKALEIRERLLGEAHPDTASSLANIGSTLSTAQRLKEAEPYLRRALQSFEETLGDSHPWVGTALGNLGNCLARERRAPHSLPLQQRSLAILEHTLGTQHPSVARTLYNLGKLMTELERYDDARETLERGLAIAASLADDDDSLFEWYKQLGDLALAQGEPAEARMHFQKGLDIRTKHGAAAYVLAPYEFDIANTWAQEDPARARAGVRQAREHAVLWAEDATGREAERATELIGKIDEWLSAHAG